MNDRTLPCAIFKANFFLKDLIGHVLLVVIGVSLLSALVITTLTLWLVVDGGSKQTQISLVQTVRHSIDVEHLVGRLVGYTYFVGTYAADDAVVRIPLLFFTRVL